MSHLVTALPQRQVQLGGGGRPVAQSSPTASSYGPNYSQQLAFGGPTSQSLAQQAQAQAAAQQASQLRARGPASYQSTQPIIISQAGPSASPATPGAQFASFPGAQFGGAGRQILTLRSPGTVQSADEDEYEYEDDDEPTIQTRPSPTPGRIQVTRAPVRINSPTPSSLALGGAPARFGAQVRPFYLFIGMYFQYSLIRQQWFKKLAATTTTPTPANPTEYPSRCPTPTVSSYCSARRSTKAHWSCIWT